MPRANDDTSHLEGQSHSAAAVSARAVHREQVWAALIRAVDFLLKEILEEIEDDLHRAQQNGDEEWIDRLMGRERLVKELRRQVLSPPP